MRYKILVVDDDDGTRRFLLTILTSAGYDVVTAKNGQAGRTVLDEEAPPHLLITDIRLGDLNGLQLIAMSPRSMPTIAMTGFADPVLEEQARQFGAKFVLKPLVPEEMLTLVAELLRNRPATPSASFA